MRKLLTILTVLAVVACPVFAGAITDLGLFNTGQGAASNWKIGSTTAPVVTNPTPGGATLTWMANTASSSWISSQANLTSPNMTDAVGLTYDYNTSFTLNAGQYVPTSIAITGRWALDNFGSLYVNGSETETAFIDYDAGNPGATFTGWHSFTIAAGSFTAGGLQTLHFSVGNLALNPDQWNPHGLRVEFLTVTGDAVAAVPEPGTLAMLGGGLLALGFFRRRR